MKKQPDLDFNFGERLAQLRKKAGLTQAQLGKMAGVSYRVIAYYEGETKHLPADILPKITHALKVPIDELLGIKPLKMKKESFSNRIWKKLKRFEQLTPKDQKFVLHYIDMALTQSKIGQT